MNTRTIHNACRQAGAWAVVAIATIAASPTRAAEQVTGSVMFVRTELKQDTTPANRSLWLYNIATGATRELTPAMKNVLDGGGSWSPDGKRIAFERASLHVGRPATYRVYIFDTGSGRIQTLASGDGSFRAPAWGSGERIAVAATYRNRSCVTIVDAVRRSTRDLYCPPAPTQIQRVSWSADRRNLLVEAGYYAGQLEPTWRALAYRIDVATGAPTVLDDRIMDWPLRLEFSPGGHRGIYADTVPWDLLQVNFTTGESRVIGWGYAPRWSRNGQRIAYTGETYEMEPEFRYYNPLYVVNADGTGTRRVTASRTPDHAYMAAAWSKDNVHVVATRRTWADVSLTIPRDALRIVNVDNRVVLPLPSGSAEAGAWFEP